MTKMVILITSHPELWFDIAEGWQRAGAPGVTIIDSHGLHRLQKGRQDIEVPPGLMSMESILRQLDRTSRFIVSIVEDKTVDKLVDVTYDLLGDLDVPDKGLIVVLPVDQVIGLRYPKPD